MHYRTVCHIFTFRSTIKCVNVKQEDSISRKLLRVFFFRIQILWITLYLVPNCLQSVFGIFMYECEQIHVSISCSQNQEWKHSVSSFFSQYCTSYRMRVSADAYALHHLLKVRKGNYKSFPFPFLFSSELSMKNKDQQSKSNRLIQII